MVISVDNGRDILRKEKHESVDSFTNNVLRYKRNSDMSAKDFCGCVAVEGLTIGETASLYADIQRAEGSNVILFQKTGRYAEKTIRFPLWKEGAAS